MFLPICHREFFSFDKPRIESALHDYAVLLYNYQALLLLSRFYFIYKTKYFTADKDSLHVRGLLCVSTQLRNRRRSPL